MMTFKFSLKSEIYQTDEKPDVLKFFLDNYVKYWSICTCDGSGMKSNVMIIDYEYLKIHLGAE